MTSSLHLCEFVGMANYAPASFHDLYDKELESDGSSIGDVMALDHPLSWKCTMADASEQLLEVVESIETHTPPNHSAEALAQAQAHDDELRQRQWDKQPPPPVRLAHHSALCATRQVALGAAPARSSTTSWQGDHLPQFARAGQNIAAAAMLLRSLPEPADPQEQAIPRNLRVLVETTAIQQAKSSASRERHAASCPTGTLGPH